MMYTVVRRCLYLPKKRDYKVPCLLICLFESEGACLPAKIAIPCFPSLLHFETQLLFTQNVAIVNPCCCLDRTGRLHPHEPRTTARLLIIHWLIHRRYPSARLPLLLIVSERWASMSIESI